MNWDLIWYNKGKTNDDDLIRLNGFTSIKYDLTLSEKIVNNIIIKTNLQEDEKILEFGCGAGRLAKKLIEKNYNYMGIEKSSSLIDKYKKILQNNNIVKVSNLVIPFPNNSFDVVFCWSVLHYLNNKDELIFLLNELKRVAKKYIFLGDIETFDRTKNYDKSYDNLSHFTIDRIFFNAFFESNIEFNNDYTSFDTRYNCIIQL